MSEKITTMQAIKYFFTDVKIEEIKALTVPERAEIAVLCKDALIKNGQFPVTAFAF